MAATSRAFQQGEKAAMLRFEETPNTDWPRIKAESGRVAIKRVFDGNALTSGFLERLGSDITDPAEIKLLIAEHRQTSRGRIGYPDEVLTLINEYARGYASFVAAVKRTPTP